MKRSSKQAAGTEDTEADAQLGEAVGGSVAVGRGSMRRCRQKTASEEDQASDIPLDFEPDSDYAEDEACTSKAAQKKKEKNKKNEGKGKDGLAGAAVLLYRCSRADLGLSKCVLD
jgi:hypothetical protein